MLFIFLISLFLSFFSTSASPNNALFLFPSPLSFSSRNDNKFGSGQLIKQNQNQHRDRFVSSKKKTFTSIKATKPEISSSTSSWFPTKIQDTVEYDKVVKSLYVRHILLETMDMAKIALQQYLDYDTSSTTMKNNQDPFGEIAYRMSACTLSRNEGGKIGWVDPIHHQQQQLTTEATLLPIDVVKKLYSIQPKAGDVPIIQSSQTKQVHVILVEELFTQYQKQNNNNNPFMDNINKNSPIVLIDEQVSIGAYNGRNAILPRPKLKGHGVLPEFPTELLLQGDAKNNDKEKKKYYIQTVGCQMNVADSERLAGVLEYELNMISTLNANEADVILLNTCSIRDHAEQKLYDQLGPYAARKRKPQNANNNNNFALIVTGCVAQQEGEELLKRIPEIDVVMGPQYVPYLKNVLESVEWGHQVVATSPIFHREEKIRIDNDDNYDGDSSYFTSKPIRGHSIRAWVNIIHGCNEHCTYCVVPATRGMEQSRTMENILSECLDLISNGYKEITLLGQNIDAYGRDMNPKRTFADLLTYLNNNLKSPSNFDIENDRTKENSNNLRIRYVTSHPRYFSDRVIDAVYDLETVCECFHMPFQSGDNNVLKHMRRGYSYESYMRIINKIRLAGEKRGIDASICGDVIVGFPGETEEAFQNTLKLMEEVKFDNLNTFAYSPRPNTEAATWEIEEDNNNPHHKTVPDEIKSKRLQIVQQLAAKHGLERSLRYVGQVVEVLVEDVNPKKSTRTPQVMGRTRQGRQVYFDGEIETLRGKFVNVKIKEARTWSLIGDVVP